MTRDMIKFIEAQVWRQSMSCEMKKAQNKCRPQKMDYMFYVHVYVVQTPDQTRSFMCKVAVAKLLQSDI